jgi:hypothetical protein
MKKAIATLLAAGALTAGNLKASEFSDMMDARAIANAIDANTDAIYRTHSACNSYSYGSSWSWRSKKAQQRIDAERQAARNQQLAEWKEEARQRELEEERQETYRKNREAYRKEQELKRIDEIKEYNARIFFNAAVADGTVEVRKALPVEMNWNE